MSLAARVRDRKIRGNTTLHGECCGSDQAVQKRIEADLQPLKVARAERDQTQPLLHHRRGDQRVRQVDVRPWRRVVDQVPCPVGDFGIV